MRKIILVFVLFVFIGLQAQASTPQIDINLVKKMPNLPQPYKMKDWKSIAEKQDKLFFDHEARGTFLPLIWWDDTQVNYPIRAFGLPSYVGRIRDLAKGNHYESLPTLGAVLVPRWLVLIKAIMKVTIM